MTDLDRALKGEIAPLWLVFGDAGPLVEEAVRRITEAALTRVGLPAFNHNVYRGGEPDAVGALATARTLPMMAERRLVVLKDLEGASDEVLQAVVDYAAEPSPSTILVLTGEGFPKVRKGGKNWSARVQNAVKKQGHVVKLSQSAVPTVRFVQDEATRLGKRIARGEAEVLVELVGDDLSRLRRELEKVALFVGDREEIGEEDLRQACSLLASSVVWDLTAGIASGDADLALAALYRQLEEGEDPRKLLGMVVWQMRQILQAAELIRAGASSRDVRGVVRMRRDQLQAVEAAVRAGRMPGAAATLGRLAQANRAMNEHRAGDRRILERLVLELC